MRNFVLGIFLMLVGNSAEAAESISHHLEGTAEGTELWSPRLLLREQLPDTGDRSRPVLYVHGATFPSALSVMFKFEGVSWADNLNLAGFDVFALDFAGYGGSERYPEMSDATPSGKPLGRAPDAAKQIERAVRFIIRSTGARSVDIIAHSWGTIPAGLFAGKHPELVRSLILFGPIGMRSGSTAETTPAWELVTAAQQHARFVGAAPSREPRVLLEEYFPAWADAYLASDPESKTRTPHAVKVPGGPSADIKAAWGGRLSYSPQDIRAPTMIIRGEWDTTSPDADMKGLRDQLTNAQCVEMVEITRATHLMHLERGKDELYAATQRFLGAPARDEDYCSR